MERESQSISTGMCQVWKGGVVVSMVVMIAVTVAVVVVAWVVVVVVIPELILSMNELSHLECRSFRKFLVRISSFNALGINGNNREHS